MPFTFRDCTHWMNLGFHRSAPTTLATAAMIAVFGVSCAQRESANPDLTASAATASTAATEVGSSTPPVAASGRATANAPASRRYPLTTCAINGREFGNSPKHRRVHQGQEVLFCCTPCVRAFDTAPEAFMPTILARINAYEAAANQGVVEPPLAVVTSPTGG